MKRRFAIACLLACGIVAIYILLMTGEIERQSTRDEARPADVIVVLGAAEYHGRPSPVLRARLDHARELYTRGLSKLILTTGGAGGDEQFTEGQVGRDYLVKLGVPLEAIVVEGEGDSTVSTVLAVSEIMRRMGLTSAILVSDGYHIFRAKRILQAQGMRVYGSPRISSQSTGIRLHWLYFRQACGFLIWRLGVNI